MIGKPIEALPTPSLIIDLDIVERNIGRAADLAKASGKKLRPHIKTHKIPRLARMQMEAGAEGICAAKLSEAQVMADGGLQDIFLANQIVGREKLDQMAALARQVRLTVLTDSLEGLAALAETAKREDLRLRVLVEVETGDLRCGATPEEAVKIAEEAGRCPNREVSVGGSPSLEELAGIPGIPELRPGVYIFNDAASVYRGSASYGDCAATVLTTVVSKPVPGRLVVDGGAKTFSYCTPGTVFGKPIRHGVLLGDEAVQLTRLSEEHGVVEADHPLERYRVGDKLRIIPTHACPVVNLFDQCYFCRGGVVVDVVPIIARGKTQ